MPVRDGERLCRKGDAADELWIVLIGEVRVEQDGKLIVTRGSGSLVGEAAFYRPSDSRRVRGADLVASGDITVFRIDASFLDSLDLECRALWHETVARVLTAKVDQAQSQRADLRADNTSQDRVIARFVCEEGRIATWAAVNREYSGSIDPELCDVLVWFSDLAGFSAHAANLSPLAAGKLIRDLMDVQVDAISDAGGHVDKFMGDGLMAFWRTPDQCRRKRLVPQAVEAALVAQERISDLVKQRDLPLGIRIGLHVGPAIIGDFGGGERIAFTLIGNTVNTASRYEQATECSEGNPLGAVRLSATLHQLLPEGPLKQRFETSSRIIIDKHRCMYPVYSSIEGMSA